MKTKIVMKSSHPDYNGKWTPADLGDIDAEDWIEYVLSHYEGIPQAVADALKLDEVRRVDVEVDGYTVKLEAV